MTITLTRTELRLALKAYRQNGYELQCPLSGKGSTTAAWKAEYERITALVNSQTTGQSSEAYANMPPLPGAATPKHAETPTATQSHSQEVATKQVKKQLVLQLTGIAVILLLQVTILCAVLVGSTAYVLVRQLFCRLVRLLNAVINHRPEMRISSPLRTVTNFPLRTVIRGRHV